MTNITLFSQIINRLPRKVFRALVDQYSGDKHSKGINSWTHLVAMLFLQFSRATSLREVCNGLISIGGNLNHLGVTKKCPKRSSLSYINEHRDSKIFKEYFYKLYGQLSYICSQKKIKFKIKKKILLIDSTLISLCAKVFPWAHYGQTKGAIKLHTLLDYEGCLPKYVYITDGKVADVTAVNDIPIPAGAVVVADREYESYELFKKWGNEKITFVVRIKQTTGMIKYKENPLPEKKHPEILLDEEVLLENPETREKYPEKLRRVVIYVAENNVTIELITNNFTWTAETIANLYKSRWQIESFFKDLKTHFKIKTFIGTSSNAVEIQIWTALITILVLKYLKAISKYNWSLSNLIAFLRMHLFTKMELEYWLETPFKPPGEEIEKSQYNIFENNNIFENIKNSWGD